MSLKCEKCEAENENGAKFCNFCGITLPKNEMTNIPLTGSDRLKIGWLFAILIIPFGGFGMAIIPLMILWSSIYIMKKDKSFSSVLNARKYLKIYLVLLSLGWIIGIGMYYYDEYHYRNYHSDGSVFYSSWTVVGDDDYMAKFLNPDRIAQTSSVVLASTIGFSLAYALLIFLFNSLFFNILERHQKWVINNGIFADADTAYSDISCTNCGHKLKSQGGFCPNCGHKG